ncbi:uncharacterized protein BKA78DRAFT_74086 [Phyllosticta capitalensis]|uniref:uncharacterized protein n=1 Tax=Phyllosticta capitalensis TaxID=121624 RepID=UPI00312FAFEB
MEVCCERPDKVAQSILDPHTPAHNSHPPMPDASRHQTTSSQAMMDVDSAPRGPANSEKDDYPNQHQYPSPASAPAQPPAPSSTAPSSAHHSPVPQSVQFSKKVYPPTNTRPSSPALRDYSISAGATPKTAPGALPRTNGHLPPTPNMQEVHFDALQRLQVQVSHQQGGLQSQRRSVDMLEAKVDTQQRNFDALTQDVIKLAEQMSRIENLLFATRQELHSRPTAPVPAASHSVSHLDDGVLEAFATSLDHVSAKVNEVDGLKMQLEILKRRIRVLEPQGREPGHGPNHATTSLPSASAVPSNYGSRDILPIQHHPHPTQPRPTVGYHGSPALDTSAKEPHPESRLAPQASSQAQSQPFPPHAALPTQHLHQNGSVSQTSQHSSGWVPVNQGAKRQLPNCVEDSPDTRPASTGSPKRPKLAPLEPRLGPESNGSFDRMDVDGNEQRHAAAVSSHETAFHPVSTPSSFVPFGQMVDSTVEAWHADPRSTMSATRDVPRRGRGGRGRGRKSLPADSRAVGTPEWDKPPMDWTGSQVVREDYYGLEGTPSGPKMPRGSNLVRRGSGGAGPLAMRPIELARPSTATSELDPYAHTKKTRTKPFRNAQGILIRKDGLPDMRSHSSAANLRKVHARKEQERILELGKGSNSPTSGPDGMSTPFPMSSNGSNTPEAEHATEQDRHNAIMRQMFPNGISDQDAQHNYHDKFFPSRSVGQAAGPKIKHEAHSPSMPIKEAPERAVEGSTTNGDTQSGSTQVNGAPTNGSSENAAIAPQQKEPVAVAQAA